MQGCLEPPSALHRRDGQEIVESSAPCWLSKRCVRVRMSSGLTAALAQWLHWASPALMAAMLRTAGSLKTFRSPCRAREGRRSPKQVSRVLLAPRRGMPRRTSEYKASVPARLSETSCRKTRRSSRGPRSRGYTSCARRHRTPVRPQGHRIERGFREAAEHPLTSIKAQRYRAAPGMSGAF